MAKEYKALSKLPAMITYIIAVLSLLVGLLFPLGTKAITEGGFQFDNMPVLQIPDALAALGLIKNPSFEIALAPAYSWEISLFGATVNVGAILLLAYILATALAVIFIIPVCVSSGKKESTRILATIAELIALTVLLAMVAHEFISHTDDWNLSVFIPFGVTLLMLIIQSIVYFRGSGVIKTVALILSVIAVLIAVGDITLLIPSIGKILANMQGARPFETSTGLYSLDGTPYFGRMLLSDRSLIIPEGHPEFAVINIIALILTVLVCINLLIDMLGLGKSTNKPMIVINLARYVAEFVLIAALYGFTFWFMGNFGLDLYLLTAVALTQLIVALARYVGYREVIEVVIEEADEQFDEEAETYSDESELALGSTENVTTAPKPAPVIGDMDYNGPTDAFIEKLSAEQKAEFAKLFLEHGSSDLEGIPDYTVGGDNTKFFSSIFIYLARVRDHISDGLMDKFYEEAHITA